MHVGRPIGHQQHKDDAYILPVGRIERDRDTRADHRADRFLQRLDAPCGSQPLPGPVEPSFSRANRLSKTWLRSHCCVLEKQPALFENRFMLDKSS